MTTLLRKRPSKLDQVKRAHALKDNWDFTPAQALGIIQKLDDRIMADSKFREIKTPYDFYKQEASDKINLTDVREITTEWKELFQVRDAKALEFAYMLEELILIELKLCWGNEASIIFDREKWTATCSAPNKQTITIEG